MKINKNNTELVLSAGHRTQFIRDGLPQFAFSGRSNVGKSSLINRLLDRKKLARVSAEPGKTITVNYYLIDRTLYLVDLPGYGYAKRAETEKRKWSELVDGYLNGGGTVAGVVQLIDLKIGPTADDEMMLDWLAAVGLRYFIVATKADKLNKTDRALCLERLEKHPLIQPGTKIIPFSSLTGEGREEAWETLLSLLAET